ncbi:MAG TPA: flavodoxin domain-containing protein [Anaerolineae bacterium]|nr:flavodoxin domain-containing protein [Anaerolineae bacterium]
MNKQPRINRRRFLKLAGGAVGAGALACGGLATLGLRQPAIEFAEPSCGEEENIGDRILVAYASRAGSTGEVAGAIGEVLCDGGATVDVRLAKGVTDVGPYRAVVVGSAIYMGGWMSEAAKFVETHRDALSRVPVAYFAVCLTMKDDTEENRRTVAAYLDPVREQVPQVQPADVGLFAGTLDYDKLPLLYRLIVKAMEQPEGDFRNWEAIRAWAGELVPHLGR